MGLINTNWSISTNLISITKYLAKHTHTDFSKVFDCIDYGINLTKLCSINFHSELVTFPKSYMKEKTLKVECFGKKSYSFPKLSGVP